MKRLGTYVNKKCFPVFLFLLYSICVFCVYQKYYANEMFPMSGDAIQFISNLEFIKKIMQSGEFPLWNKWLAGGIPLTTAVSPLLLFAALPAKQMVYAIYIGAVSFGAVFTYLYLREIKCTTWAALAISVCYLFSVHIGGLRKSHVYIILSIVVLPAILYFIERYFSKRQLRFLLISSIFMALQVYIGALQQVVYTDIFLIAYLLAFGLHYRMKVKTMLLHGAAWGGAYLGLIAFNLLPQFQQNWVYSSAGASRTSFEIFTSYSIHPIKLIEMLFPHAFGETNYQQAFGPYFSSELDAEIFLGFGIFALLISGIILLIRDFRIRFSVVAMGVLFVYGALGAFPSLAKIIYNIPYIGDFRCPARDLFLFIFLAFTIAAIMLSHLEEKKFRHAFLKICSVFCAGCFLIICIIAASVFIYIGVSEGFEASNYETLHTYLKTSIFPDLLWIGITVVAIAVIIRFYRYFERYAYAGLCVLLTVSVVIQTYPFMSETNPSKVSDLYNSDAVSECLKEEIGNYKIWDAFQGYDPFHESIISLNKSMTKELASLNAYIAFNNPSLYRMLTQETGTPMNSSGLLVGSFKVEQNLHLQNSLLSMLGVKYIIDSSGSLKADTSSSQMTGEEKTVYEKVDFSIPASNNEIFVTQDAFHPEADTYYRFSLTCYSEENQTIAVDLYGGPEYDSAEQEVTFQLEEGKNTCSGIIFSGDSDLYPSIVWRIMTQCTEELQVSKFTVGQLETEDCGNTYVQWNPDLDPDIYVNQNARDILYIPDAIKRIEDTELLYQDTIMFDVDSVNYMENMENKALVPERAELSNIDFRYNIISADITTGEDTFVNFSQCYYPGWTAYVDGERTQVYEVNGLIMGMEVPAGTHHIQFIYEPLVIWVGAAISLGTVFAMLIPYIYLKWKKDKKDV